MTVTASLLLGALLGAANAAAAMLLARRAAAAEPHRGIQLVLASLLVRLVVLLAAVAGVLVAVPVVRVAFVAGLGVVFVAGLVAEVFYVQSRAAARPTA